MSVGRTRLTVWAVLPAIRRPRHRQRIAGSGVPGRDPRGAHGPAGDIERGGIPRGARTEEHGPVWFNRKRGRGHSVKRDSRREKFAPVGLGKNQGAAADTPRPKFPLRYKSGGGLLRIP